MKATYPTVKSEADFQKRRTLESQQAKQQANKRPRSDENSHEKDALVEDMLETRHPGAAGAPVAGPTDFSGLFPKVAGTAPPATAVPQQQQPQRAARTFEDLASQRHSRAPLASLMPGDNWLPPALPAFNAGDATNPGATAAAGALGTDRQLAPSDTPPLDWSLKTTVRFSSPSAFTVAEDAELLSSSQVIRAQRAFVACDGGTHMLSMQQRYLAALHSWQYPQDPWRQPAKRAAPPPEAVQRRKDWQAAFSSLYDALRTDACDAFYVLSPEGTKKPYAAFFGAAGVGGRRRVHALLTRSTAGLRALLQGGLALGFAAPLLPAEAEHRAERDQAAVSLDNGSQSLLVFDGALRVHGLFDFLINSSFRSHGDECDVPTLLAPVQFAHASLRTYHAKVLGPTDDQNASRRQYHLELRSSALPPWVLDRLISILTVTQDGNFSMVCDTHPLTLALNWRPSSSGAAAAAGAAPAAAEEGGTRRSSRRQPAAAAQQLQQAEEAIELSDCEARQRGCLDAGEAWRWRTAVPGLSCNVVRELRCQGDTFSAKLSAKSAERVVL